MKKSVLVLSAVVIGLAFTSCGPDSELVASGKVHSCKLKELAEKMKTDPDNAELQEEFIQTGKFLQTVVESAGEGNEEAMREAINAAAENCD